MAKNDGGPAFPRPHDPYPNCQGTTAFSPHDGLTKREIFAMAALPALIVSRIEQASPEDLLIYAQRSVHVAVVFADAMIAELERDNAS